MLCETLFLQLTSSSAPWPWLLGHALGCPVSLCRQVSEPNSPWPTRDCVPCALFCVATWTGGSPPGHSLPMLLQYVCPLPEGNGTHTFLRLLQQRSLAGQDKAGASGDTAGKRLSFLSQSGTALLPASFSCRSRSSWLPHTLHTWRGTTAAPSMCGGCLGSTTCPGVGKHPVVGMEKGTVAEGSMRGHQRKLWRHWESCYRNLCPQHPTLLPFLSSQS